MKKSSVKPTTRGKDVAPAVVIDWCGPFARKVLSKLHEYDDAWPRPTKPGTVIHLPAAAKGHHIAEVPE